MLKIVKIGLGILTLISLTACSDQDRSTMRPAENNSNHITKSAEENRTGHSLPTKHNYLKIVVGNPQNDYSGTTVTEVREKFGEPNEISKIDIAGTKRNVTQYSWSTLSPNTHASAITVQFLRNRTVGKAFVASVSDSATTVSANKVARIKSGAKYQSVLKQLGTPNGESVLGIGSPSHELTYLTDEKGHAVNLTFIDNKLVNKNTTKIK